MPDGVFQVLYLEGLQDDLDGVGRQPAFLLPTQLVAAVQTMTGICSVGGLILIFWEQNPALQLGWTQHQVENGKGQAQAR